VAASIVRARNILSGDSALTIYEAA
jgi:hypothetical protein